MQTDQLDILRNIKRVEVSHSVLTNINSAIQSERKNVISLFKVGIAASVLMVSLVGELYFLKATESHEHAMESTDIVPVNDNALYYE